MRNGSRQRHVTVFLLSCLLLLLYTGSALATVTATRASIDNDTVQYTLTGSSPPPYSVTERFAPFRVVMDINGTDFAVPPKTLPKNNIVSMQIEELKGDSAPGKRFVFTLADSYDYDIRQTGNEVTILFTPAEGVKLSAPPVPVQDEATALHDFQIVSTPNSTSVTIRANRQIEDYTVDTLTGPNKIPRMFIDIPDVNINGLVQEKIIGGKALSKIRIAPKGDGVRIIFEAATARLFAYSVAPSPSGLDVVITEEANREYTSSPARTTAARHPVATAAPVHPAAPKVAKKDSTLDTLISSSEKIAAQDPETLLAETPVDKLTALEEAFSMSGYEKQRITVDFYKIDIHNVFRLFREITELNIIVDESVQGSLTLALNDVPWDFALDIILNLMHLKKKEKFNTIVIYPADKEFVWPTRAEENLSFQPDMQIIEEQDALVIEKTQNQPAEILKAKELLRQAQLLEKQDNLEDAVLIYDKALALWPTNPQLSNRLATLHLVKLGMNAKALHYAKQSLEYHPENRSAALYAAIASANMQRLSQANEFFTQSISDTPPMKEALMSYAAFCENNAMNEAALKLLAKYEKYYGENVSTMIAKARIFEKTGRQAQATSQYQAILASGYQLPPDLRRYMQQRITEGIQ